MIRPTPILIVLFTLLFPLTASAAKSHFQRLVTEGLRMMGQRQYSQAIDFFDLATRSRKNNPSGFYHLGNAYYHRAFVSGISKKTGKNDALNAVDSLETALSLDPKLKSIKQPYMLFHALGQSYELLGQHAKALYAHDQAGRVSPKNPMPHLYSARILHKMKSSDQSSSQLYYAVERARSIKMYSKFARLIRTDKNFSSILDIKQNQTILNSFDAVQARTLTLAEAKDRIRGLDTYRDALTNRPSRERAMQRVDPHVASVVNNHLKKAKKKFKSQRFFEAIESYEAALKADKADYLNSFRRSRIYERIGFSYLQIGLADSAVHAFTEAIFDHGGNSGAHYGLTLAYAADGMLPNALKSLENSLKNANSASERRRTLLLARTDSELVALRTVPQFSKILRKYSTQKRRTAYKKTRKKKSRKVRKRKRKR